MSLLSCVYPLWHIPALACLLCWGALLLCPHSLCSHNNMNLLTSAPRMCFYMSHSMHSTNQHSRRTSRKRTSQPIPRAPCHFGVRRTTLNPSLRPPAPHQQRRSPPPCRPFQPVISPLRVSFRRNAPPGPANAGSIQQIWLLCHHPRTGVRRPVDQFVIPRSVPRRSSEQQSA